MKKIFLKISPKNWISSITIKIVGNIRYFYMMQDYVTPNSYGDLSSKSYRKLNCTNIYIDFKAFF